MKKDFSETTAKAGALFLKAGFVKLEEDVDPVSDNGVLELRKKDVVARLVRDRKQWFVEIRSSASDEWFDARFVLAVIGGRENWPPPTDLSALRTFVEYMLQLLPKWERLFRPDAYAQTKRELNERERISARERFGITN